MNVLALATTMPSLVNVSLGSVSGGVSSLDADLSRYTPDEIDAGCPYTTWPTTLPDGTSVNLTVGKFMTLLDTIEVLTDDAGNELTLVLDDERTYRVLAGIAIACADRAVRPLLLSPTPVGTRTLRSYESDVRYLCLKFKDPADGVVKWFCGKGRLADGVTGYASKGTSPRPFYASSVTWGGNTWTRHFEFDLGVGSLSRRIESDHQTGYALDTAWNLNPNDTHADGTSKRADYLAGLAVKTATNRNGVRVSPYNWFNKTAGQGFNTAELNQCQNDGTPDVYLKNPDVVSSGSLTNGVLIDLAAGPWYFSSTSGCSWAKDWGLVKAPTAKVGNCTVFTQGTVGLNLGDGELPRCPSWSVCPSGATYTVTLTIANTGALSGPISSTPGGLSCKTGTCTGKFLCGTNVTLTTSPNRDGTPVLATWSACPSPSATCTVPLTSDNLTVTVSVP